MKFILPRALGYLSWVCVLCLSPARDSAAHVTGCEAMAQQSLNRQTFGKDAETYANLATRPEATVSPAANLYGAPIKSGSLEEHGSAHAVIDYDLWPQEKLAAERRSR